MKTLAPRSTRDLHDGWTLSAAGGPVPDGVQVVGVPATVPGSVHTDLLAAGVIPDPYLDANEGLLKWIGHCDWEYRTSFDWAPDGHERHELVFDGLDTVAEIRLNGAPVGATANMHRTYRFDVAAHLAEGANELVVRFSSPVRYADAQSLALGYRPQVNHHPFNAMRKMACSFGWDWGIDTATSGIWRPVRLESWSTARLAAVRPVVTVTEPAAGAQQRAGRVDVHVELDRTAGTELEVSARLRGHGTEVAMSAVVPAGHGSVVVPVDVASVELWWPRGHGDQPLYELEVELAGAETLDRWAHRIGFRTVRLDVTPDAEGTSFTFVVNGHPVWVRGANWIPDDAFPHRVSRQRYAARLDQAETANMNLLRVWGGGFYEDDAFYELCDERGIMTWQDFAFACAAYSEDEPLRSEVEAEARDNVTRLMPHASLVLWNGSNENIWGYDAFGFRSRLDGKSWGLGYYEDVLPSIVDELDPGRPYTPSSPWSGELPVDMERDQNDPDHGSMHNWELWNRQDWPRYRDTVPRFMAEFGWQGPPTWSTLTRSVHDDPLTPESPGMQVHQKAMSGNDKLTDGLVAHVPLPDDMEDWHWAMSWNQATAVRVALEHLRSWSPSNMGAVVWQLNDCWPVTSWAAVDGDGHAKPLLHGIRRAFADRLVTIQPRGIGDLDGAELLAAFLVNDTDEVWTGDLVLRRLRYDGTEAEATKAPVEVAARGIASVPFPSAVAETSHAAGELLTATLEGAERATWFFVEPRDSELDTPVLETEITTVATGARVRATAGTLVRDLTLLADKVHPDAVVDEMFVDLLPGESVVFDVVLPEDADPRGLAGRGVLRSLNELVGTRR